MRVPVPAPILWTALASSAFLSSCSNHLRIAECEANPAQDLLSEINGARAREGVPPVWVDVRLARAAEAHARALAEGTASGHFGLDGSDPLTRISDEGYQPGAFGENVAMGSLAPRLVVEAWLASPGHRLILLDPSYQEVGLGGVLDPDHPIWVADFGSEKEPPQTRCHPWLTF
jgi:uncharacterized protein YkwD